MNLVLDDMLSLNGIFHRALTIALLAESDIPFQAVGYGPKGQVILSLCQIRKSLCSILCKSDSYMNMMVDYMSFFCFILLVQFNGG